MLIGIFCAVFFTYVPYTHAQSFFNENTSVHLIPNPEFPSPNSQVQITLDDYSVQTTGADITWYIQGTENKDFRNERSISLVTGTLGEKITVRVVLTRSNAPALSSSITIVPSVVDLILEANTYVPDFYKGRALPSTESRVRAIAVVHDNSSTPDTTYTYKWMVGDAVMFGGPVKGKNVLDFDIPHYDSGELSVEVFNSKGETLGKQSLTLPVVEPELHFYEHNPLRGLYQREVANPLTLIGEETTIYGEPYFMNTRMREQDASFSWSINSESAEHDAETPNAITLRHVGGEGSAEIGLTIVTKGQIPQFLESAFSLFFQ